MNETWICVAGDKRIAVRCLNVMTWSEVRQFATKKFGDVDPATIDLKVSVDDGVPSGVPVLEVQWVGNDFSHGGTPLRRRMQERALGAEEWADA
jgi:hypothetical protein